MARRRRDRASRRIVPLLVAVFVVLGVAYVLVEQGPRAAQTSPPAPRVEGTLRVHYVDVGQGDGTIWELPDGSLVVYDCGPPASDPGDNPIVRYLRDALDRPAGSRLLALVASHGHLDHIGGCEEIFEEYVVEHVYEAWYEGEDAPASYVRFQEEVLAENATLHRVPELQPGATLALPARATLLWPRTFAAGGWDAIAEASLVVRLEHGATSFCFQGDIETRQENELSARCDAYLVGHHGSRTASSAAWLARMRPSIAIVSYGDNSYGHPHPEALCRVEQAGAALYATADSDIIVESDGASLRVLQGERVAPGACDAPG